jgi:hypothetical protein
VIWAPRPPSLYGPRLSRTVPAVVPARLAKISASCPNICGRIYFHHFLGKNRKSNSAYERLYAAAVHFFLADGDLQQREWIFCSSVISQKV